jgi:glucose/arabinose dehydrogenase
MQINSGFLRHYCNRIALTILLVVVTLPAICEAQIDLRLTRVSDQRGIVDITNAGDGSNRLFLVEQRGRIFILKDGTILEKPFLSMQGKLASAQEQGLLSLAFAPDYAESGNFYVWYTALSGGTVLSRFRVSEDPDVADPGSEQVILPVAQPFDNHNGGRLQFGPDGMLYLGLGDGGAANDPDQRAQDGSTLLGKLIRIDVDPAHQTYAIPADNPFVGNGNFRDEIWALGLRNPWKISFDTMTGDLFIADVGQNQREEVNFQPADSTGGENYGWDIMEGTRCVPLNCDLASFELPVAEYDHDLGCSITGGEMYRGSAYPGLYGTYLFGDWCSGNIWGLKHDGSQWVTTLLTTFGSALTSFGLGEDGSMYAAWSASGIFLVSDGEPQAELFRINAGLNDAWYNPLTNGQGFFINVFPDIGQIFLAWFTYDVERPDETVPSQLGDPGARWITAQGPYADNKAVLDIFITKGGIFDASPPEPTSQKDGDMLLEFSGCNAGTITYTIPSINRQGTVPVERIALDNIPLCETLATQAQ